MCRVLNVSESGFHAQRTRPLCKRKRENRRLEIEILVAHQRTRETYSAKRLHHDLADHGVQATPYRVRTLRKKLGLRCKQKLKFKVTTDSKHNLPVAHNILNREFSVNAPGKVWVSDITYIPTNEGWLYLAGVKDLFNGELVGYAMNERMTKNLVIQALFRATASKHPDKGLIAHSDRGGQYCAHDYQNLLQQFGMIASMSPAMIMLQWKASGGYLKLNWCTIGNSKHGNKRVRRLPNILRSSITGSASKKD